MTDDDTTSEPAITGYEYGWRCGECGTYHSADGWMPDFDGPVTDGTRLECSNSDCEAAYTVAITRAPDDTSDTITGFSFIEVDYSTPAVTVASGQVTKRDAEGRPRARVGLFEQSTLELTPNATNQIYVAATTDGPGGDVLLVSRVGEEPPDEDEYTYVTKLGTVDTAANYYTMTSRERSP